MVVVLVSRMGDLVSSILVCVVAVLCLSYIAPPAFSFRVDDPLDVVAIIAFLTTSVTIARLVSKLRKMAADARFSVHRKLIDAEEREYTRITKELQTKHINQRIAVIALNPRTIGRTRTKSFQVGW